MLAAAGAPLEVDREDGVANITLEGVERLALEEASVPGDLSSAAFFVVAATIVPGSELLLRAVGVNPKRTGLLSVMERMGARVEVLDRRFVTAEPVAELAVGHANLRATTVGAQEVPRLIDELPLVALLGAFAEGTTVVEGAGELRHKESDRIAGVVEGLRGLGADIEASADGFVIEGHGGLRGGALNAAGDHRMAMLGAVAGLVSDDGVDVRGFDAVSVSYPSFAADLASVAAG
jgi:3-phosphoshikimate 1-carboxyvinyltransferase